MYCGAPRPAHDSQEELVAIRNKPKITMMDNPLPPPATRGRQREGRNIQTGGQSRSAYSFQCYWTLDLDRGNANICEAFHRLAPTRGRHREGDHIPRGSWLIFLLSQCPTIAELAHQPVQHRLHLFRDKQSRKKTKEKEKTRQKVNWAASGPGNILPESAREQSHTRTYTYSPGH